MDSKAFETFKHAIKDADDLLAHFDSINAKPPPPEAEVLKRASLVMALAALETYMEDRAMEWCAALAGRDGGRLSKFYRDSLESDLKYFHTPNSQRIKTLFQKYFGIDVTAFWSWNNYDPVRARTELDRLAKMRGDFAHRSWRPKPGESSQHAVTRDEMRKNLRFIRDLVGATDMGLRTGA